MSVVSLHRHFKIEEFKAEVDVTKGKNYGLDEAIIVQFIAAAYVRVLERWLTNGMPFSPRVMAEQVVDFVREDCIGFFYKNILNLVRKQEGNSWEDGVTGTQWTFVIYWEFARSRFFISIWTVILHSPKNMQEVVSASMK